MTVTAPQLRSAAALTAAVQGLACRVDTAEGRCVIAGAATDAQMCALAFRQFVIKGDWSDVGAPTCLAIDGVDPTTGFAAKPGERYLVSPLSPQATIAALREAGCVAPPFQAMVRGDDELAVSVVRLSRVGVDSPALEDPELDELSLEVFSTCLIAHLTGTTDVPTHHP
ncbi:hypothetical protein [Demequina sp.]|uniref:hypothetical protein n=1 Tax=Demequina sp. TaxID=2050685 RepID=UPI003A859868